MALHFFLGEHTPGLAFHPGPALPPNAKGSPFIIAGSRGKYFEEDGTDKRPSHYTTTKAPQVHMFGCFVCLVLCFSSQGTFRTCRVQTSILLFRALARAFKDNKKYANYFVLKLVWRPRSEAISGFRVNGMRDFHQRFQFEISSLGNIASAKSPV